MPQDVLLALIKNVTPKNMSVKDFITGIESQYDIVQPSSGSSSSSSSSSKSRARFSKKSRSRSKHRSPSSHARSSKSSLKSNNNNNNDDNIVEDTELQSSSSSSSHVAPLRSRSRSRSSYRSHHSSSSSSRRRSKSRSRSRSRSSRHRRHKSRSHRRSRSRSRSRSPSRRRHSSRSSSPSRSRSRSSSPPRPPLSVPDPLQPDFKPLSNKTMKELERGNFIHFNNLIRQLTLSSNPVDNRHETKIGDGLVLSSSHRPKLRRVENSLDWFEVCFSSIMPSMAQQIVSSTSITDAHTIATTLQQHICYALHAVTLFRQNPAAFSHVFKYLESHRETSVNVAEPNPLMLQKLYQCIMNASNSSNSRSSSSAFSNSSSSSSSSKAHSSGSGKNSKRKYDFAHCGQFNSREGCKHINCKFPHICRECKSAAHSKPTCPKYKSAQEAEAKSKPTRST